MNLNESELEEQLRRLRPRAASPQLEERLAAALALRASVPAAAILRRGRAETAPLVRWLQGVGWALAGAAAAVVAITFMNPRETVENPAGIEVASSSGTFEPTESTEELVTAEDEGLVLASDQEPVRQVRYHSLERHVWVDPRTGARMEFEIPREDVRFMPVAMQ